ncbi:hypothetical protein CHU95_01125 [Niveispirillum lacus]|uniref:Uncharacterized protein n=1 Tax=Niveispirillum lacus TaxID=1981099 RepID=A0A255Z7R9_9PROT|nr:hypothetical protein [Niveispirillum lacus]OYQ37496.1 hypothetical protein CHU95_01125 [Niveispirillum lacus]
MNAMDYGAKSLEHITITTGHSRTSSRNEVDPEFFPILSKLIRDAVSGKMPKIPGDFGKYHLSATVEGNAVIATVWSLKEGRRSPVVTFGVATDAESGAPLWRALHNNHHFPIASATDPDVIPEAPWCAVRFEIGLVENLDATTWLGDFERCVAWAWVRSKDPR